MAVPTIAGKGGMGNVVVQEIEWTLPKAVKGAPAKAVAGAGGGAGGGAKVVAGKGAGVNAAAGKGVGAKCLAINGVVPGQGGAGQVTLAAMPGMEWELPEAAGAGGGKGAAAVKGGAGAAKGAVTLKGAGAATTPGGAAAVSTVTGTGANVAATGTNTAATGGAHAATTMAKASAGGGTIWNGTGLKLGWGLGLGAWGPVLLAGTLAAVGYGVYNYMKNRADGTELEEISV